MEGHLTESRIETDGTDELPVLSDEAVLRFRLISTVDSETPAQTDSRRTSDATAVPAPPAAGADGAERPLEAALETLRATLESAERRWQALERRLKNQDRAIAELKAALCRPDAPVGFPVPGQLQARTPEQSRPQARTPEQSRPQVPPSEPPEPAPATAVPRDSRIDERHGAERELLERIAALETYIAGRADRWREMEREVDTKAARITELETELAQRIAREQQLEQRLHHQGGRAQALRDKLRSMNRRIRQPGPARTGADLDPTTELTGPAGEVAAIVFEPDDASVASGSGPQASDNAPELVCLSSELGERYVMNKEAITIGRADDCDIQIFADFVSRQHATIRRQDSAMYIEDESSTNGVYVNAERVRRRALADGDEITIGESRFRFVSSQPPH